MGYQATVFNRNQIFFFTKFVIQLRQLPGVIDGGLVGLMPKLEGATPGGGGSEGNGGSRIDFPFTLGAGG